MKIDRLEVQRISLPLTRPYEIAFRSVAAVDNVVVRLVCDDGRVGLGAAAPEEHVTGETTQGCVEALESAGAGVEDLSVGEALRFPPGLVEPFRGAPAARAAFDMALHDVAAQRQGKPLAQWLGLVHTEMETSITIGIKPADETLAEAKEYIERGFRILKLKLGESLDSDLEKTRKLRERVGRDVKIRVDVNQAYGPSELESFIKATQCEDLEFIEQPFPAGEIAGLRNLPPEVRKRIAIDESLLSPEDAAALVSPAPAGGIFNIKLMKCGGIEPARRIADVAGRHGVELMWGCMDESRISIAAALHAAFSCPATRYLDLDGSFDLARDVVEGGFTVEGGWMRLTDAPGLGVRSI